jgi:RNA polymerase sigma-70 factor, ECF subfamily
MTNEQLLVQALKSGSEAAFAELYDRYSALILGVVCRFVQDREDAENIMQDCFVKVWHHMGDYAPEKGRLATWLISIARNAALDFTRSKYFLQRSKNQNIDLLVDTEWEFYTTQIPEETIGLRQLVDRLEATQREILESMYFDGLTQQEIADQTGIPLGTIKTRTRAGLRQLRTYFGDGYEQG